MLSISSLGWREPSPPATVVATFGYASDLGLPKPSSCAFVRDPQIKCEAIRAGPFLRPVNLQGRTRQVLAEHVSAFDRVFTQIADPERAPEVLTLRESIRGWRFYDHFRSDADALARLIVKASQGSQVWVVSHASRLIQALKLRRLQQHPAGKGTQPDPRRRARHA